MKSSGNSGLMLIVEVALLLTIELIDHFKDHLQRNMRN